MTTSLNDKIANLKDYLNTLHENDTIPYSNYSELFDLVDELNEHLEENEPVEDQELIETE